RDRVRRAAPAAREVGLAVRAARRFDGCGLLLLPATASAAATAAATARSTPGATATASTTAGATAPARAAASTPASATAPAAAGPQRPLRRLERRRHRELDARRHRHDDVDLSRFRLRRRDVADDRAVLLLRHAAGIERLGRMERVIPVAVIAIRKLVRVVTVFHDDALGHEPIVERGRGHRVRNARNRERDDGLAANPLDG